MRVLLIAYEFPPILAAQALRWYYLANELAALGMDVHVLCPAMPALRPYRKPMHPSVVAHRVWPGPFIGLSQRLAGQRVSEGAGVESASPSMLFLIYRSIRFVLDRILYPDVRTEWYPFARAALADLLARNRFDVVISSHEPGVDLLLGLWTKKHHAIPWVVDLADPLCAPYSPRWRRWLDRWVEGRVIRSADRVVLTTNRLSVLLQVRHGLATTDKFVCIPQGAPMMQNGKTTPKWRTPRKLNIVFTGNFYATFRNPGQFALALEVLGSEDIALIIAGDNARFLPMFDNVPNVRFLGRMGHFDCLDLQAEADVLLNIGNAQAYQIPGKVYEYMGAGRTILHLRTALDDPSEALLLESGLGRVVDNDASAIIPVLSALLEDWRQGRLQVEASTVEKNTKEHGWASRARVLHEVLEGLAVR